MEDDTITATMDFCPQGEKVIFYPADRARSQWPYAPHEVKIHDMRPHRDELTLEKNAICLLNRPTAVRDFYDREEVERVYLPEVIDLIQELTGADKVITFGLMTRTNNPAAPEGNLPAFGAHVDYGDRTTREQIVLALGEEEAAQWLDGRYILTNVWRPIKTVRSAPFAICDGSTVAESDLCESIVYGGLGNPNRPPLYGHAVSYNENQQWYWAPEMQPDEVFLFKLFDSDPSAVQWAAHSSFSYPGLDPDAPPRESVEVRTIALFRK